MAEQNGLAKIFGNENVIGEPEALQNVSKDLSFVQPIRPRCLVRPGSIKEVISLVSWANETQTPLVPMSSGVPHMHGNTLPGIGGSVIADFSRMDRIIRVDSRNRVVMVEPGVTFTQLVPALKEKGLKLNLPLLPRSSKSVAASVLEREPVIMPKYHWDAGDPLACVEVVYGSGETFRTGSAAGSGDVEYQWESGAAQVAASGPAQADFHRFIQGSAGTMGMVTWATIRCEKLPNVQEPFLIGSATLDELLELNHWLIRLRLVDECLILNRANIAQILSKKGWKEYETIRDSLPQWILFYCVAGYEYFPEERIDFQKEAITNINRRLGLEPSKRIAQLSAYEMLDMLAGPPEEPYWKLRARGSCHDIFFIANRDKLGDLITAMKETAEQCGFPLPDIGIYLQPVVQGTSYHCEFDLPFDAANAREVARVKKLAALAPEALMAKGAFFSRPYGAWADMVYRRDAETTIGLRKIKSIFDPNNIMNPGKLCF